MSQAGISLLPLLYPVSQPNTSLHANHLIEPSAGRLPIADKITPHFLQPQLQPLPLPQKGVQIFAREKYLRRQLFKGIQEGLYLAGEHRAGIAIGFLPFRDLERLPNLSLNALRLLEPLLFSFAQLACLQPYLFHLL